MRPTASFTPMPRMVKGGRVCRSSPYRTGGHCFRLIVLPKLFTRGRGERSFTRPEPPVNNFGGGQEMGCGKLQFLLNRKVEHAGSGRRIFRPNARRLNEDFRSGTLRPVVKEYSEPFACKCRFAETNRYKPFRPAGTACSMQP